MRGLPRLVQQPRLRAWSRTTRSVASAPTEQVFDEQTGELLATLPIDTGAVAAGRQRRHDAVGERRRAEPAHPGRAARSRRACPPTTSATRCAATRRRTARTPARYEALRSGLDAPGVGLADVVPRASPPSASFRQQKDGCTMKLVASRARRRSRRSVPARAPAGAVLALPFLESLAPREAAGQAATPPKRFIVLKSFSTQLVQEWYPRFTGNGYALKDSKYAGAARPTAPPCSRRSWSAERTTPGRRSPTSRRRPGISGILGPALNPVPVQADADPRTRFPAAGEPQLRRPARQLLVVHGGHPLRRRQPGRRARPSIR